MPQPTTPSSTPLHLSPHGVLALAGAALGVRGVARLALRLVQQPPERHGDDPVMLFDATCVLCCGFARFVSRFERAPRRMRFAALQSVAGRELLGGKPNGWDVESMASFAVVRGGKVNVKFDAVVAMFETMGGAFGVLGVVLDAFVPKPIGDVCYSLGWRWRKQLFGEYDACVVPRDEASKELRARVVEGGDVFDVE